MRVVATGNNLNKPGQGGDRGHRGAQGCNEFTWLWKSKQNSRHDSSQGSLLPPLDVIRNSLYPRWMFSFNQEEKSRKGWGWVWGSCLAISSVSRCTGRKEARNLHISFKHLLKCHQDSELQEGKPSKESKRNGLSVVSWGQVLYVYPQRQDLSPGCLRGTEELGFISHFRLYFPCFQSQYSKTTRYYVYSYCLLTLTSFLYAHARMIAPWPVWYVMNVPFLKISFSITLEKSIPYRGNRLYKSWYMDRVPRNHSEARSLALER